MMNSGKRFRVLAPLALAALLLALTVPVVAAASVAPGVAPASAYTAAQEPEAPAPAEQAGDEHAAEEAHETEAKAWWYWPSKWFNFIALCALLWWMLVNPPPAIQDIFSFSGLKTIFIERGAAIIAARDLAVEQKGDAAQLLSDSEQRLTKIEEEVAGLVAEARSDAVAEQERALKDGAAQAQKIHDVARREVGYEGVAAQRQLRGFVADLAVNLAKNSLAEHLTPDDQDRLIREYLSRLGPSMA